MDKINKIKTGGIMKIGDLLIWFFYYDDDDFPFLVTRVVTRPRILRIISLFLILLMLVSWSLINFNILHSNSLDIQTTWYMRLRADGETLRNNRKNEEYSEIYSAYLKKRNEETDGRISKDLDRMIRDAEKDQKEQKKNLQSDGYSNIPIRPK